ncbi:Protein XRI1 [Ananas comosus]|uniref:Protein XRI1 n=1 Tax=Ananas comosus TaxID=4615 RepID=A0A199V505_ANACO|nr:Protein XRI1 [Ananas comosus]
MCNSEMWEWRGEGYDLQRVSLNDVSHCLWGDVNQNGFLYMLDEQTPIKDCTELSCQVSDIGDYSDKGLEECLDSSQIKRRRMLQFTSEGNEVIVAECSMMEDGISGNFHWDSQWNFEFSGIILWLLLTILMFLLYNISPETGANVVEDRSIPAQLKILTGSESVIDPPTKFATSVAYPFALIKPCGAHGDLTLHDINERIHAKPMSKIKHKKDEDSIAYSTSAFSGKPVVVKTKIRTEGGKGSITITRTRG